MIRLEIEAADAAEFNVLLGGLFRALGPPSERLDTAAAEEATGNHVAAGFTAVREVPAAATSTVEPSPGAPWPAGVAVPGVEKRRPGRPRKVQEGVTIDGTVNVAPVADPPIVDPDALAILEPEAEAPKPLLDLPALKDAYSLDEIRALAIDYVKAVATPEGGSIPDSQFARGVLGGMLSVFGVEKVGDLPEGERVKLAKLIHHLAALGRPAAPPAASVYVEIVKSF